MDKKRLLELAGVEPKGEQLNELWGEGFESPDAEGDDMEDGQGFEGVKSGGVREMLAPFIQRAARSARREGMEKADFDHMILELTDSVWSQMQSVRKRGERQGSTPRF